MSIINGKALVKDGNPLDRAYSNGQLVYGRNLVRNTGFINDKLPFTGNFREPYRGLEISDGVKAYKIQHTNVDSTQQGVFFSKSSLTVPPSIGGAFTVSAVVRGSGYFSTIRMEDADHSYILNGSKIPSEWTKITITGKYTGTGRSFVFFIRQNSTLYIRENSIKVESGNELTDWTPAPEDYI